MANRYEKLPLHIPDTVRAQESADRVSSYEWQEEWRLVEKIGSDTTKANLLDSLGEINGEEYELYPQVLTAYFSDIESQKARLYVLSTAYKKVISGIRGVRLVMLTALYDRQVTDLGEVIEGDVPKVRLPREEAYRLIEKSGTKDIESTCQIFFCTAKNAGREKSHRWVLSFIRKVNEELAGMELPLLPEPGEQKIVTCNQ